MTNKIIELFIITLKEIGKLIYRYIVMVYYKCTFHFELSTIWLNYHTRIPKPPPHPVTSVSTSGSDDCGYPPPFPVTHTWGRRNCTRYLQQQRDRSCRHTHTCGWTRRPPPLQPQASYTVRTGSCSLQKPVLRLLTMGMIFLILICILKRNIEKHQNPRIENNKL